MCTALDSSFNEKQLDVFNQSSRGPAINEMNIVGGKRLDARQLHVLIRLFDAKFIFIFLRLQLVGIAQKSNHFGWIPISIWIWNLKTSFQAFSSRGKPWVKRFTVHCIYFPHLYDFALYDIHELSSSQTKKETLSVKRFHIYMKKTLENEKKIFI